LASFVGDVRDVWCGDNETLPRNAFFVPPAEGSRLNGGLCVFQGWPIVFDSFSTALWWAVLGVHTAYLLYSAKFFQRTGTGATQRRDMWVEIGCSSIAWGLPLLCCIVAAASGVLVYEVSATYCFIASDDDNAWQIGLWFFWIGLCLLLGSAGLIASLTFIWRARNRLARASSSTTTTRNRARIARIVCFLVALLACYSVIFAQTSTQQNNLESTILDQLFYFNCLFLPGMSEDQCRDDYLDNDGAYAFRAFADACLASQGFLLCIIVAAQGLVWLYWLSSGVTFICLSAFFTHLST
jgi:hypothetical protein